MSAMKRSLRPVGQILIWQMQHRGGEGAATAVRSLTTITTNSAAPIAGSATKSWLYGAVVQSNFIRGQSSTPSSGAAAAAAPWRPWIGSSSPQVRFASSSSGALAKDEEPEDPMKAEAPPTDPQQLSDYWGVTTKSFHREDGSKWPWNCFRPQDTYSPNYTIDITKHREPTHLNEKLALWTVKSIKIPVNLFFSTRYGCRAMMLETVAAVPGMVGGMLLHLKSLRRFSHSGGWIKALLDEAENERMHLMTLMDLVQPVWYERALVVTVQGIFFNFYFLMYLISPRLAHRVTGYLEEEAIISYTTFLNEIDAGVVENVPCPEIAIDYWRLPKDAKLRDMILALRADEAHHRDVNHYAADVRREGKELHESPAPVDYH